MFSGPKLLATGTFRNRALVPVLLAGLFGQGAGVQAQVPQSQPASLPELRWHLTARPWEALGSPRTNLLDRVEDIVNALAPLQYWNNASPGDVQDGGDAQNGAIIDPFELKEWQYGTPYFSFAVATVVSEGRSTGLVEAGARALDHSTADIAGLDGSAKANDNHGEFFGPPMMKALRLYKQMAGQYPSVLTAARIARWESRLRTSRVDYMNNGVPQNWRTYAMKGEWLRVQDGLVPRTGGAGGQGVDWIEDRWRNEQRARYARDRDNFNLDPYFLTYHDDDPGPKQNFSYMGGATGNLLDMVYNGYDGPSRAELEEMTRFCARSCLLMVAGNGDAPAGGRTGDHVWNDVVWGNMFELASEMAWAEGNKRLAGQFRRAARLALRSSWRFQQEQGWFSVTKSLIHPSHQNHYATWSALVNYNGYTEIHSSEAFATEISPIPELPAPSEIGGYVAILDEQFDTTFANAGGMQVQICTEGSGANNLTGGLRWHTLGIVRFSRPGWETRLGPGDGWTQSDAGQAISFAPTFYENGAWQMVSQQPDRFIGVFTPSFTHPLLVRGTLTIGPKSGQTGPSFAMDMTLTPDGVLIDTRRTAGTESFGITWPLMEFDGKHVLSASVGSHIATTAYPKMSATRLVMEAENGSISGGVTVSSIEPGYSGTGYALFPASGGVIEWTGVQGGDGGEATIGFRYSLRQSTAASRTVTLLVNGAARTVTFEHTGNPNTYGGGVLSFPMVWHQVHLPVSLNAGAANTIRLQAGAGSGLNIDELRVFPADASRPEPDQQAFICLDAAPGLDASTPVRRTAYGDQRPVRVTNGNSPVTTFVYPRAALDPEAEAVRANFVRVGTDFSSVLGRVEGDVYVGRTAAGGVGAELDVENDGTKELQFSETCGFVTQLASGVPTQIETDRFVTLARNGRQVKLAPYTPILWSDTGMLWNNAFVPVSGLHFEVALDFTPPTANTDLYLGFAGEGVMDAADLPLGLRFGADGMVRAVPGPGEVDLPYQAGTTYHVRVRFDLVMRRYSVWVRPNGGSEQTMVANAPVPAAMQAAGDLDTLAYNAEATAVSEPSVTGLPELSVALVSPSSSPVLLHSTNVLLQLMGAVNNADETVKAEWTQDSGPGTVTFGDSDALVTTAGFSVPGTYELGFGVQGTTLASTGLTVVVLSDGTGITNGLFAWWKMDETGGAVAADSSGAGRTASLSGGSFVSGYVSNAVQFPGTSAGFGTYAASDPAQLTLSAWVRSDGNGGGNYPFILGAPSYRLIFRSGDRAVGFATWDEANGDWHSGVNTISQGVWYHVAVTYDRSDLTKEPAFYINGLKYPTVTLRMPSGTPPTFSGAGYIGNRYDGARGWLGLIDDLRIYSRVLSETEIAIIATHPPPNVGPLVFAGANQVLYWPEAASLTGSVIDDGLPNPPGATGVLWSQVAGAGAVVFGDEQALATSASFSAPGTYRLQLTADDGQMRTVSRVMIEVLSAPTLGYELVPGGLVLRWETQGGTWGLQSQTNAPGTGIGSSAWLDITGSEGINQIEVPIDAGQGSLFYRLIRR